MDAMQLLNHQTGVLMGGQNPVRQQSPLLDRAYESYTCADGDIIVAANDKLYAGVCRSSVDPNS